jgi:hypothetical protein
VSHAWRIASALVKRAFDVAREGLAEERGQPIADGGVEALGLDDDGGCVALRERGRAPVSAW